MFKTLTLQNSFRSCIFINVLLLCFKLVCDKVSVLNIECTVFFLHRCGHLLALCAANTFC